MFRQSLLMCSCALAFGQTAPPAAKPKPATPALGELLVAPTRVFLEGRKRTAEVVLMNTGPRAATYRVSFVQMAMDEAGELKDRTAPAGEVNASDMLRFSPRQVTLEPGVSQIVRLQVRKPAELGTGEYRSHLLFQAIPDLEKKEAPAAQATGISINLVAIPGVSIPVYIRHGETKAEASLADLRLDAAAGRLSLRLQRTGNQTVYGDLRVEWEPASGKKELLAIRKGLPVYHPLPHRNLLLPLALPAGMSLAGGRLHLTYRQPEGETLLAEAWVDLK